MAASLAQAVVSESVGNVNTRSLSFGSNTTAGNTIIVVAEGWRSGGQTFSYGDGTNTYAIAAEIQDNSVRASIGYAYNIAGGPVTVTITPAGSASYYAWAIIEVAGLTTTDPKDKTAITANAATTTPVTGSTGALTQAAEFAVAVFGEASGTNIGSISVDSSFNQIIEELDAANHNAGELDYLITAATTALNVTWTLNNSHRGPAVIATFLAAAGGGGGGTTNHFLGLLGVGT